MTKAFLMATPAYMTGVGANDTLPSNNQGYGRLDLGRAFDGVANVRVDETQVFGAAGQTYTVSGSNGFSVGTTSGLTANLRITGGTLSLTNTNIGTTGAGIGPTAGATGNLIVDGIGMPPQPE